MRRIVVIAVCLLLLAALAGWLLHGLLFTAQGIASSMRLIGVLSPVSLSAGAIEGSLARGLHLKDVRVTWREGEASASFLAITMEPLYLLSGSVSLREVKLGTVAIEDRQPAKDRPDVRLPEVKGLPARLRGRIGRLIVEELSYRFGVRQPLIFRHIRCGADWDQGVLALSDLSLGTPSADVEGRLGISFLHPALQVDGIVRLREPVRGYSHVAVNAMLRPARRPEQMAGALSVTARGGSSGVLLAKAEVGVEESALSLRNVVLSREGCEGLLWGSGRIGLAPGEPAVTAEVSAKDIGPFGAGPFRQTVWGDIKVSGSPGAYEGSFRMGTGGSPDRKHEGVRMGGAFRGGAGGMAITISEGSWLRGRLEGRVEMTWPKGLTLRAVLTAKGLDPAGLHRELRGTMEARGEADLSWADGGVPSGTLKVRLRESILQGKRLSGLLEARLMPAGLRVERAFIDGNGFHLSARGVLDERLDYEADVTNAQAVIPSLQGTATGRGWVRLRKGLWAGAVRLNGRSMEMGGAGCARMSLDGAVDEEGKGRLEVKGKAENGHIGPLRFETLGAVVEGTPTDHLARFFLDGPQGSAGTALRGGMAKGAWTGSVETMELAVPKGRPLRLSSKAQIVLSLERIAVSGLTVTGPGGETAGLDGHVTFSDGRGQAGFRWEKIDLARFNAFLAGGRIDGETSGSVSAKLPGRERMDLDVGVTTAGSFTARGQRMEVAGASLKGQWNERGLSGHMGITIKGGGVIRGTVNSPDAGTPGFPLQTGFSLSWEDLDVAGAGSLFPPEVLVEGRLAGRLEGTLVKGGLFDVKGETKVTQGAVGWKERDGVVRARVKGAAVRFLWAQEAFRADGSFDLEERGQLRASCTLPFPARYPFAASRAGPVQASVTADLKELGILPALLRGAVRETRGSLKVDAGLSGTWQEPRLTGQVVLADAAAYLPQAGIRIEDVKARLRLADDRIEVVSLEARSGPGRVKATAFFRMKDWRIEGYEGTIEGDRFEALYLPEARIALSPALSFRGKGRDVAVTGQVTVPEGKILGRQRKDVVRASSDVVIVDKVHDDVAQKAFPVTGKVRVILGDRVAISMDGLEGRLTGDMIVDIRDSKDLSVTGELQIVEGGFSYYGQRLDLDRGRIIFNGPPDNPALDILAIKKIRGFQSLEDRVGEVKAGVAVTGRIRSPFIRLYSQPSMPDVDVLSYILMGRKTTRVQGKDSSDAVMGAAGALAYGSLKSKVSPDLSLVDTVDVQSGGKDMSRSLVTVGKYLNPRLYLGLGGSLFTNTYQIILRYSLTPNLDVESRSGTESGASIYYKIEFD